MLISNSINTNVYMKFKLSLTIVTLLNTTNYLLHTQTLQTQWQYIVCYRNKARAIICHPTNNVTSWPYKRSNS